MQSFHFSLSGRPLREADGEDCSMTRQGQATASTRGAPATSSPSTLVRHYEGFGNRDSPRYTDCKWPAKHISARDCLVTWAAGANRWNNRFTVSNMCLGRPSLRRCYGDDRSDLVVVR